MLEYLERIMQLKLRTFFFKTLIVSVLVVACKKNDPPTKPPVPTLPDTTSHDFTWQIDILGDGNGSSLNDVCIIDKNNVWAVGKISVQDSTGEFIHPPYGAAVWNGNTWELKKLKTKALAGYDLYLNPQGIFAFGADDIWFAQGGIHHYNGEKIRSYWINRFPGNETAILDSGQSIEKIWGTSSTDLWAVGTQGSIIHYNGNTWQKIESGTYLDIQDIWGDTDPDSGEDIILAVAGNTFETNNRAILKINGMNAEKIPNAEIDHTLKSVWFDPGRIYYVAGDGIYSKVSLDTTSWGGPGLLTVTNFFSHAIRGNHINDVFVVGAFGDVLHFNGNSWCNYREYTALSSGGYHALAVKDNCVIAVGTTGESAVILSGKRN